MIGVYLRVSTTKKRKGGNNRQYVQDFEMQKRAILAYITTNRKPNAKYKIYEERMSGGNDKRPVLKQLIDDTKKKRIKEVMVYNVARFSRHADHAYRIYLDFLERKIPFTSVTEPIGDFVEDFPLRKSLFMIFAELAERERILTSQRIKEGIARRKAKGTYFGNGHVCTPKMVKDIKAKRAEGLTIVKLAEMFGVSPSTIVNVTKDRYKLPPSTSS